MDRLAFLRDGIGKHHEVLEIGPYFNPIAARRDGYRVTSIDVFDTQTLRKRGAADPNVGPVRARDIEEVDLLGSACDAGDLTVATYGKDKRFDWILSSHNFEHLPDPIRFLQQCASVLAPTGILRMAVPDKRSCFDHFRQLTEISEWLQAFHEKRTKPTIYQVFREESYKSVSADAHHWEPMRKTLAHYRNWFGPHGRVPDDYMDTHCWTFTPESFELLVRDVVAFGLVHLSIDSISEPHGLEFYVDLRRSDPAAVFSEDDYFSTRATLLNRCIEWGARPPTHRDVAAMSKPFLPRRGIQHKILREAKRLARQISAGRKAS